MTTQITMRTAQVTGKKMKIYQKGSFAFTDVYSNYKHPQLLENHKQFIFSAPASFKGRQNDRKFSHTRLGQHQTNYEI